MRTLERKYDARITEVFQNGAPGAGGRTGPQDSFTYSAIAVDTTDILPMTNKAPFRRWIFPEGVVTPDVIAASIGDDCEIAMCQGQLRLVDVPEQYLVSDCDS